MNKIGKLSGRLILCFSEEVIMKYTLFNVTGFRKVPEYNRYLYS